MTAAPRIKRIYDPALPEDGKRILVDRIWPRGLSKQTASLDLWLRDVAPSTALRQWFGHEVPRWEEFRERYRNELAAHESEVATLVALVEAGRVTLLYGAHDPLHNNAKVLAEYINQYLGQPARN